MEILQTVLPIIIDILLIIFLVVCIILGIKGIKVMDKFNALAEDAKEKLDSLNSLFNIVTLVSNKTTAIAEKTYSFFDNLISRLFSGTPKKRKRKVRDEEDELKDILDEEEDI